jgi:hypothetical protein
MDRGLRWTLGGLAGTAFFTCLALAFPGLSPLATVPGAFISLALTVFFFWPEIGPFHARRKHRMLPLIGMIVFALAFAGSAAWYFWPALAGKPWKHSLEDLFASDNSEIGSLERGWNVGVSDPAVGLPHTTLTLRYRLYPDFNGNAYFVSIFVPMTQDARVNAKVYDLIKWLRDEILPFGDDLRKSIGVGMSKPGVPYTWAKDMKFSGRVFIYTMEPLTIVQLGELTSWYAAKGMALQIRGQDYWAANKDR